MKVLEAMFYSTFYILDDGTVLHVHNRTAVVDFVKKPIKGKESQCRTYSNEKQLSKYQEIFDENKLKLNA